jgi:hypothetical protein
MNGKQLFFNLLYILLIVGVLAFCGWFAMWMMDQGGQCVRDPIAYYYNNSENVICTCKGVNESLSGVQLDPALLK